MPIIRNFDGRVSYPVMKLLEEAVIGAKYTFEETMNDLLEYWRNEIRKGRKFLNR